MSATARSRSAAVTTGEASLKEREGAVQSFQECGGVLVATLDSLSVGVTLHRARIVIMHDLGWVPAELLQGEARVYRIGQHWPVLSKWMVAKHTLDEMFVAAVRRKGDIVAEVVGDEQGQNLADALGVERVRANVEKLLRWARS